MSAPCRRLAVVGLGLIGGSVALAARVRRAAAHIVGADADPAARAAALRAGAVDEAPADLEAALAGADLVVLCVPPRAMLELLPRVAAGVAPGALVTDVASTKVEVVTRCRAALAGRARYVGGHPLAGSERSGFAAARPDLFRGATWFLTPASPEDRPAAAAVARWVRRLGARPAVLAPEEHDALLAATSHLPQFAASAVAAAVGRLLARGPAPRRLPPERLAGPGYRDTTRLAGSDPGLWVDIALTNAENIVGAVDALLERLGALRALLLARDADGLRRWLEEARAARRAAVRSPREEG